MSRDRFLGLAGAVAAVTVLCAACGSATAGGGPVAATSRPASGATPTADRASSPAAPSTPLVTLKPIANVCDLVTPAEVSQAMGAPADAPASSTPTLCAYISSTPAPGATDDANLSFGYDATNKGRAAFDQLRQSLQITDVSGVGDAAILQDNQNGTGKLIFIKADTIFSIDIATGANAPVTDALVAFGKLLASRA